MSALAWILLGFCVYWAGVVTVAAVHSTRAEFARMRDENEKLRAFIEDMTYALAPSTQPRSDRKEDDGD